MQAHTGMWILQIELNIFIKKLLCCTRCFGFRDVCIHYDVIILWFIMYEAPCYGYRWHFCCVARPMECWDLGLKQSTFTEIPRPLPSLYYNTVVTYFNSASVHFYFEMNSPFLRQITWNTVGVEHAYPPRNCVSVTLFAAPQGTGQNVSVSASVCVRRTWSSSPPPSSS